MRKFDFFEKWDFDSLLGPPKEFFDTIKKGSKAHETVPLSRNDSVDISSWSISDSVDINSVGFIS